MNFKLVRSQFGADGILGELFDETGDRVAVTLEHAYQIAGHPGIHLPKLPPGSYKCWRRLSPHFRRELFEITKVKHDSAFLGHFGIDHAPGHTDILFHAGNFNEDSDGCVLLGEAVADRPGGGVMITNSRRALETFMADLDGVDCFDLVVESVRG